MSNVWFPKALTAIAEARVLWRSSGGDTIKAILIDTGTYTYDSSDEFLSDIPSGARVSVATMSPLTPTYGVYDAADTTFSAVSGSSVEALIIYQHTGTEATSRLLIYCDSASAGLPVTPTGADILVRWSSSGIATL